MMLGRSAFPEGFTFGAATAAYQIEGHAQGGAGPTHWDTFAATPGNVVGAEDGAVACDHLNRWEEDLDLLAAMGADAYRFSTSWARILPEGRGAVNEAGLDFYDRLVDGMLARGLKPFHTLYHWEMPSALSDLGGWTHPDVAHWAADYTEVIARRIGDRVHATATINEPWCVAWLSHFEGHHAPGLRDIRAAARATHNVLRAHAAMMERLRGLGIGNIGICPNFHGCEPQTDADTQATARARAIHNRLYVEPLFNGTYPAEALEGIEPHLPRNWQDDMAAISASMDWMGVQYYTRNLVHATDGAWPSYGMVNGDRPTTQMGWEVYPEGLHDILTTLRDAYTGDLPLYITENGMAWDDHVENGAVNDPERQAFVADHLTQMHRAIADGVQLKGFFYWSLLDNYEWAFGYAKRFGLIHVDFDTQTRTPKGTYHALKEALAR
ncbi:MAG: GH1 family beta-glucosidase [Shimia sp.]